MATEQLDLPFNTNIIASLTPRQLSRVRAELYDIARQVADADEAWARAYVVWLLDMSDQEKSDEVDRRSAEANAVSQRLMQLSEPSCLDAFVKNLV